jgi:hypothetical protein
VTILLDSIDPSLGAPYEPAEMSRIEGIAPREAGFLTRVAYWFARRRLGEVPKPLEVYAHNPWVMRAYGAFELMNERATKADKRLKMLASIKTGTLVGCPW